MGVVCSTARHRTIFPFPLMSERKWMMDTNGAKSVAASWVSLLSSGCFEKRQIQQPTTKRVRTTQENNPSIPGVFTASTKRGYKNSNDSELVFFVYYKTVNKFCTRGINSVGRVSIS
jgi:hypothetical protein